MREFVFLDDAPIFGGAEQIVLRLARFVEESMADRSARVVCPITSMLADRCRGGDIRVEDARFPGFGLSEAPRIPFAVRELRRVLARTSPDALVVGVTLRSLVYAHVAALGLRGAPRVVHFLPEQDSARRLTTRIVLQRYGGAVALGENAAQAYRSRAPGVTVLARNNPLLPEEFEKARGTAPAAAHSAPVLGVLARLIPEKGQLDLVGELAEARDTWSTLLIGGESQDVDYARALEERIASLGLEQRVRMLGRVNDIGGFFTEIDALVVPSVGNEGQPTVIVEALAHGRPVMVREPIWSSADFEGLPVFPYRDASDLERRLSALDPPSLDPRELVERFGPLQLLEAFEAVVSDG